MPKLTMIKILGNLKFLSQGLKLPNSKWHPHKNMKHYTRAFKPRDKVAVPTLFPPWFRPQEHSNRYYQKTCDKVGKDFKDLHDAMIDAVAYAHQQWKLKAKFQDVKVNAVTALGMPGCLQGPELESYIKNAPSCKSFKGNRAKYRDAVAKGVSACFGNWQTMVMVPGLPWYPPFAAFPSANAPPTPNIPVRLIACVSPLVVQLILPPLLKAEMVSAFDGGLKQKDPDKQHEALFDAIATVLSLAFIIWLVEQKVEHVMGKGPVPTYAPPTVPAGPVVGGEIMAQQGHCMT